MFDKVKSLFQPAQHSNPQTIMVNSPADYQKIPKGFFRCAASGKETLGYYGSILSWEVRETVVDGVKRVTLSVPRAELPLVKVNLRNRAGEGRFIDTDLLDGNDGSVDYAGVNAPRGCKFI